MPHDRPPEPWHPFFLEIDKTLDHPVALHCIGGFAIAMLHGLPRPTVDVDCLTVIPVEETAALQLHAALPYCGQRMVLTMGSTLPIGRAGHLLPALHEQDGLLRRLGNLGDVDAPVRHRGAV